MPPKTPEQKVAELKEKIDSIPAAVVTDEQKQRVKEYIDKKTDKKD